MEQTAIDPRYILEITDQYRQYGPWGIRVPSGGTIYFNTKEEAVKYMEEHPWSAVPAVPPTSAPFEWIEADSIPDAMTKLAKRLDDVKDENAQLRTALTQAREAALEEAARFIEERSAYSGYVEVAAVHAKWLRDLPATQPKP